MNRRRRRPRVFGAVVFAAALALLSQASIAPAAAESAPTPGSLDTSFDGDGKVVTALAGSDQASAVAIQPDGRIVVVGSSVAPVGTGSDFAVVRYNVDGSLDATFGGDGVVVTPIGPGASRDEAFAVALQPDGRIVVAGDSYDGSLSHAALARYDADGTLDPTFGGDGTVVVPMGTRSVARGVAIQGAGRIVVAGGATTLSGGAGLWVAVARLTPDGALDSTFAGGGTVIRTLGNSSGANAVAVQPDGKIVVAGQTAFFNQRMFAVLRFDADGGADSSFGDGGIVVTEMGTGTSGGPDPIDIATAVDLDPDGRIVVAGFSSIGSSFQMAVVRYRSDGGRDSTFGGGDGIVTTQVGSMSQAFGVAVDGAGRPVVAGDTNTGGNIDFAVVRYHLDGSLDAGFGSGGVVTTPFGSGHDRARGMAIVDDGRIVVAGHSDSGATQNDFAVARYHGDPPADTTAPRVQCGAADGLWHPADVEIACAASDAESGLADPGDASFSLSTAVAAGTESADAATNSRQVCDKAGNCATAGPIAGNRVDKLIPAISMVRPGEETYLLNEVVPASYSCADGGSGIASCSGPVADGAVLETASVGTKGFTVSATDQVGNEASETVTYAVAYDLFLLYDPAKPTRRIRLRLHDALGANVSSPTTVLTVESIDGSADAGGTFDYSNGADGYGYRVDTRGLSSGSHTLEFTAGADPTVHSVPFTVR